MPGYKEHRRATVDFSPHTPVRGQRIYTHTHTGALSEQAAVDTANSDDAFYSRCQSSIIINKFFAMDNQMLYDLKITQEVAKAISVALANGGITDGFKSIEEIKDLTSFDDIEQFLEAKIPPKKKRKGPLVYS